MRRLRRLAAALSSAVLMQFSLLGSGTLCPMLGGGAMVGDAAAPHVVMAATMPHPCGSSENGCRLPWAPGQQCASMASCMPTPVSTPTPAGWAVAARHALVVADVPRIVSSPAAAPELPPPRG